MGIFHQGSYGSSHGCDVPAIIRCAKRCLSDGEIEGSMLGCYFFSVNKGKCTFSSPEFIKKSF